MPKSSADNGPKHISSPKKSSLALGILALLGTRSVSSTVLTENSTDICALNDPSSVNAVLPASLFQAPDHSINRYAHPAPLSQLISRDAVEAYATNLIRDEHTVLEVGRFYVTINGNIGKLKAVAKNPLKDSDLAKELESHLQQQIRLSEPPSENDFRTINNVTEASIRFLRKHHAIEEGHINILEKDPPLLLEKIYFYEGDKLASPSAFHAFCTSKVIEHQLEPQHSFMSKIGDFVLLIESNGEAFLHYEKRDLPSHRLTPTLQVKNQLETQIHHYNQQHQQEGKTQPSPETVTELCDALKKILHQQLDPSLQFTHEELAHLLAESYLHVPPPGFLERVRYYYMEYMHKWGLYILAAPVILAIVQALYHQIRKQDTGEPEAAASHQDASKTSEPENTLSETKPALALETETNPAGDIVIKVPSSEKDIAVKHFTLAKDYWNAHQTSITEKLKTYTSLQPILWKLWQHSKEYEHQQALSTRKLHLISMLQKEMDAPKLDEFLTLFKDVSNLLVQSTRNSLKEPYKHDKRAERKVRAATDTRKRVAGEINDIWGKAQDLTKRLHMGSEALLDLWEQKAQEIDIALMHFSLSQAEAEIRFFEQAIGLSQKRAENPGAKEPSLHDIAMQLSAHKTRLTDLKSHMQVMVSTENEALRVEAKKDVPISTPVAAEIGDYEAKLKEIEKGLDELFKRALSIRAKGEKAAEALKKQEEAKQSKQEEPALTKSKRASALPLDTEQVRANEHVQLAASIIKTFPRFGKIRCTSIEEKLVLKNATLKHIAQLFNALLSCPPSINVRHIIPFLETARIRQDAFHLEPHMQQASAEDMVGLALFIEQQFGKAITYLAKMGTLPARAIDPDYSKNALFAHLRQLDKTPYRYSTQECIDGIVQEMNGLIEIKKNEEALFSDTKETLRTMVLKDGTDMIIDRIGEYASILKEQAQETYLLLPKPIRQITATIRREVHHPHQDPRKHYTPHDPAKNSQLKAQILRDSETLKDKICEQLGLKLEGTADRKSEMTRRVFPL